MSFAKRARRLPGDDDGDRGGFERGRNLHASLHHPVARAWSEPSIRARQLMYPVFVSDRADDRAVAGFEPNKQWGQADQYASLVRHLGELARRGLSSVMLFGVVSTKSADAHLADAHTTPVVTAIRAIRQGVPSMFVAADVCLCEYTANGHCGFCRDDVEFETEAVIDNARTVARLTQVAVAYARAGAHMVCPSDMMDGRVGSIRAALERENFAHVMIMAYTSKKASVMYAPFRNAVESTFQGTRTRYQHPVGSTTHAVLALERDLAEGADVVIVKPSLFYGDLVRDLSSASPLPVAVYVVSGEYVMLRGYGQLTGDLESVVKEAHVCMLRAGATLLITYFAPDILDWLPRWG